MNHESPLPWADHVPEENLLSGTGEEFTNLLGDLDFSALLETSVDQNGQVITTSGVQIPTTLVREPPMTEMEGIQTSQPQQYPSPFLDSMQNIEMQGVNSMHQQHLYMQESQQRQHHRQQHPSQPPHTQPPQQLPMSQPMAQQLPQAQLQRQHGVVSQTYGQPLHFVPPTPNSTELHGGVARFPPPLDISTAQRRYEPYTRPSDDTSAFTPLISPAMTPLEQQIRFPEFTTPGEYLTPLTSPALEAHNSNGNGYVFGQTSGVDMGLVTSHAEMTHPLSTSTAPSSPAVLRKHRRKSSIASRSNSRLVRQSPSMRPTSSRQKSRPGSALPNAESRMWNRDANQEHPHAVKRFGSQHGSSTESSGQDSVSPEPLTEPLMPPPAIPRAYKSSPYMSAQESNNPEQRAREAATPATLMNLQKQPSQPSSSGHFSRSGSVVVCEASEEAMEDISLPEPATNVDQTATSSSSTLTGPNEDTPKLGPKQASTPKLKGESTRSGTSSVTPSPLIGAMKSPMGPVGLKRADSKPGGRTSKKRPSGSTSQMSPALRPKISPSIQPLIRGEGISSETSALYLASKSNYQHILEGTVLPGVSYPETLAENLSSKRTNHKLAEQGRRNRINTALKEIESLLPTYITNDRGKDKEQEKNGENGASKSPGKPASHQPISKASTVELAIVYIKALQKEIAETKEKLEVAEAKLATAEKSSTEPEVVKTESRSPESEQTAPSSSTAIPTPQAGSTAA